MMTKVPLSSSLRKLSGVRNHQKRVVTMAVSAMTREVGPAPYRAEAKNK